MIPFENGNIENLQQNQEFGQDRLKMGEFGKNLNSANLGIITATLDTTLPNKDKYINSKLDELEQKFA